jgi:hypothetical protein
MAATTLLIVLLALSPVLILPFVPAWASCHGAPRPLGLAIRSVEAPA